MERYDKTGGQESTDRLITEVEQEEAARLARIFSPIKYIQDIQHLDGCVFIKPPEPTEGVS